MRITLLALGSRGDVQPLLALAVALQCTGNHRVRLVAPDDFAPLAGEYDVPFFPIGMNARVLLGSEQMKTMFESGTNIFSWVAEVFRTIHPLIHRMMENTWQACQDAQVIVCSAMGIGAYHIAEKLGLPCFWSVPFPSFVRTRVFPSVIFPPLPLGARYNLFTYFLGERLLQLFTGSICNQWRKTRLNLPPIAAFEWPYGELHGRPLPVLFNYSPCVVPKPVDWGEHVHVTGYWSLDPPPNWKPPDGLIDFIQSGQPPVFVGFGSLAHRNPEQTTQVVMEALTQSGQRGVLMTGWGGMDSAQNRSSDFFVLESIPHAWLFPHMAAVVHHGGSGTTGAGLCAGVPSVLVPHAGDQPFWARRVAELNVGPQPIPRRQLTADRLATAVTQAVSDSEMRTHAAQLGERCRAEDGVHQAVRIIEHSNG